MNKALPLSIISLATLLATPALAGHGHKDRGHRSERVVDARQLRTDLEKLEYNLGRLKERMRVPVRPRLPGTARRFSRAAANPWTTWSRLWTGPGQCPTAGDVPNAIPRTP